MQHLKCWNKAITRIPAPQFVENKERGSKIGMKSLNA